MLDIGLALNRSLVFAVVGTSLLGSFHFLQVLASRLLHFDDPAKAGLLSGVLAVLVVLAYPKIKPWAEQLIDRLFFSTWLAREADPQRFVLDAKGFTQTPALATALVAALDRFTMGAGAALYTPCSNDSFERQATSLPGAPATLAADEPLAVALRAGREVVRCDEAHSTLAAELALSVARQRSVEAWVLIGHRRDGRALRADEVAALRDALHNVGVEWQALRWRELQRALAALTKGSAAG